MLTRLLLRGIGGGSFEMPGYVMTAGEVQWWQDQAALLDPLAYEYVFANATSRTVPGGERWYLVNGWNLDATGAGGVWFHRPGNVDRALMLGGGTTITTGSPAGSTAFMYLCKPSLVTGSDARYSVDPRGLYFNRLITLGTLTQYKLGNTATGAGTSSAAFPADFNYGFVLQTSVHDVAWLIMANSALTDGLLNTHNEISDSHGIRWAEPTPFPFTRTTMPKVLIQGVSLATGAATMTYVKLPGGW